MLAQPYCLWYLFLSLPCYSKFRELLSPFNNRQKFCLGPEENHQNCFPHDTNLKGFDELKLVSDLTMQRRCALTFRRQMHHLLSYKIFHKILSWSSKAAALHLYWWYPVDRIRAGNNDAAGERRRSITGPAGGHQWHRGSRDWSLNTRDTERPSVSWDWPSAPPTPAAHAPPSAGHTQQWEGFSYSDKV